MKVLLVYPKCPITFWSFRDSLKYIGKKAAFDPLGLITIASMFPQDWETRLIDENVEKLNKKNIEWADMIFISAMLIQRKSAQRIIDSCKKLGKTVVAGGPVFTSGYKNFTGVDHFVLNEAEITLPMFLKDLKEGSLKKIYTSDEKPDLSLTPLPMYSLLRMNRYSTVSIQFSRGCPHDCDFCDIVALFGRKTRTKSPEQIVRELDALYSAGWRGSIFFVDDNFIGHKEKTKEMLRVLIKWQEEHSFPFTFLTEVSVKLVEDQELMDLMSEACFNKVFVGIETPNTEALASCNKTQNINKDLSEVVSIIHKNGFQVMGGFIVGFDTDKPSIFSEMEKFIRDNGIVNAMVGMLMALPKTELYKRLKKEGRLNKAVATGNNVDGKLNFKPIMGADTLVDGYKKLISRIYSPKEYYKRISIFIKNYNNKVHYKVSFSGIRALFRSMWKIGLLSKARFYYWKLVITTSCIKPKMFGLAIEFAIMGEHFRKVARKL